MSSRGWRLTLVIVLALSGLFAWGDAALWEEVDPGRVVKINESEIGFTGSWLCNAERVSVAYSPSSVVVRLERQPKAAKKFCAIGDCGAGAVGELRVGDPTSCVRRYKLREPIDGRRLIVNGEATPFAPLN